jgi:hypothetical protein
LGVATLRSPLALAVVGGLARRAAAAIAAARAGRDGRLGTADDRELTSLAALDAVPFVGVGAAQRLFRHADEGGFIDALRARLPAAPRLIAIGDYHGDLASARRALALAGVLDDAGDWSGGDTVVVQVGDTLDRGDDERALLDLADRLATQAAAAGGAYVTLLGNHELMNVEGDFRYVTDAGFAAYDGVDGLDRDDPRIASLPRKQRGRAAAFLQGGPEARRLARHNVVVAVGDTLLVHGGLTADHIRVGLERINHDARAFMLWDDLEPPAVLDAEDGPVWNRDLADDDTVDCDGVADMLALAGARRIVVGHTVQEHGITSACDESVFRVDVGMSRFYGGPTEVLELAGGEAFVLGP